jgi:putative ABC transport system permease protein
MRLVQDFRFALRTFFRGGSVSALAVLAFALGIGITSAVFSIFNGVLLKPLPYPNPDELVMVYDTQPACSTCPASFPKYHDWLDRNQVFSAMCGSVPNQLTMTGQGEPERLMGVSATATLLDVFQVRPRLGRWFTEREDQPGAGHVAVLSYRFWMRRFNGAPNILSQRLILDGEPYQVIGVMPEDFNHRNADLFVPLARTLDPATRGSHFLVVYARMKPGMTVERAATEMRALGQTLAREFGHNHGIDVASYHEAVVGRIRAPLQILMGAVLMVLLIACANVANLLLAAGLARRRELAIRLALGAGQRDLARQLTAEAIVLALAGGAIGLLLALWAVRSFLILAANVLPRASAIAVDGRVVAFTAALSLFVGLFCGLWPLVRLRTRELASSVREGDTRTGSGTGSHFGNGLVIAEIAIAFSLLVGAGLLLKNLMLLERRDTGIRTERLVTFDVSPTGERYKEDAQVSAFYRDLLERLRTVRGVQSIAATNHLPMYRYGNNGEMQREGGNPWAPGDAPLVEFNYVGGDYFQTMGIPLLQGRVFDQRDQPKSTPVVVVSRAMAQKFWPGENPIGKRVAPAESSNWFRVIGVVGDVRSSGLVPKSPYEFYQTIEQQPVNSMTVVLRTEGDDPGVTIKSARQIVTGMDSMLAITTVQTMEQIVSASVGQPRLMSALTALFAALAGLLAMVGIYGVTSYNVRRQRREFGIRIALGAEPRAVQRVVVGRGLIVALVGIGLGVLGSLFLTRTLQAMLNDVQPTDPSVFVANAVVVLLVSVLACYLPARSAGRVDPMVVLRDN